MKKILPALLALIIIAAPLNAQAADYYAAKEPILAYDAYVFFVSVINPRVSPLEAISYAEEVGLISSEYVTAYRHETGRYLDLDAHMTRQEFAMAAERTLHILKRLSIEYTLSDIAPIEGDLFALFADGPEIRKSARSAVEFAVNAGIIKLYSIDSSYFTMPDTVITIDEIADFIAAVNLDAHLELTSYSSAQLRKHEGR